MSAAPKPAAPAVNRGETKSDEKEKGKDVRRSNIVAAKGKKKNLKIKNHTKSIYQIHNKF